MQWLPSLTHLDVSWCDSIQSPPLSRGTAGLRVLVLHGCDRVEDTLCNSLGMVEVLDLAFTAVTDQGLRDLAACSPQLTHLTLARPSHNIWGDGLWTERGLEEFKEERPGVHVSLVAC